MFVTFRDLHKTQFYFLGLFFLGLFLRLFLFGSVPNGLNQDEVSAAYEAFSLAFSGSDRWGDSWPVYFVSWGSGQNVLYSYLSIPFVRFFGLNHFSTRVVSLILGISTIPIFYFYLKKFYSKKIANLGTFIFVLSPWHVILSRWGLEANIAPFFVLSYLLFFNLYISKQRFIYLLLGLSFLGLSFYSYILLLPVGLLFLLFLLFFHFKIFFSKKIYFITSFLFFLFVSSPILIFFIQNTFFKEFRFTFLEELIFSIPLLPASRLDQVNQGFLANLLKGLVFLFIGFYDGLVWNNLPYFLPLGVTYYTLVITGFYFLSKILKEKKVPQINFSFFKKKFKTSLKNLDFLWLLAFLPTFLISPLNINRTHSLILIVIIFISRFLFFLADKVSVFKYNFLRIFIICQIVYLIVFFFVYYFVFPSSSGDQYNAGLKKTLIVSKQIANSNENIYLTESIPINYIYVLFYDQVKPEKFRENSNYYLENGNYMVENYKNFYFVWDKVESKSENSFLIITKKQELEVRCQNSEKTWENKVWLILRCYT